MAMRSLGALQSLRSGPAHTLGMHAQCHCATSSGTVCLDMLEVGTACPHMLPLSTLCPGWQPALTSLLDMTCVLHGSHQHGLVLTTACTMSGSWHSGIRCVNCGLDPVKPLSLVKALSVSGQTDSSSLHCKICLHLGCLDCSSEVTRCLCRGT